MTRLDRLTRDGRRLVTEEFLRGEQSRIDDETLAEYVEPVDASAEIGELASALDDVIATHDRYEARIDAAAAPHVHRHVDVPRVVAADPGVWHYLTVAEFPEFVRYRWEYNTEKAMREKFLAGGRDVYSNALHRLWWIAELTHDPDDDDPYQLTRSVFRDQFLANRVFDREFARYRPAAVVCCDELLDATDAVVDETTLRFNHALSNLQLEGLDETQIRAVVRDIRRDVEAESPDTR